MWEVTLATLASGQQVVYWGAGWNYLLPLFVGTGIGSLLLLLSYGLIVLYRFAKSKLATT